MAVVSIGASAEAVDISVGSRSVAGGDSESRVSVRCDGSSDTNEVWEDAPNQLAIPLLMEDLGGNRERVSVFSGVSDDSIDAGSAAGVLCSNIGAGASGRIGAGSGCGWLGLSASDDGDDAGSSGFSSTLVLVCGVD